MPSWAAHGDINFYRNAVKGNLIPQGNNLATKGWCVDFLLPEQFNNLTSLIDNRVNIIPFGMGSQIECFGDLNDHSSALYSGLDSERLESISHSLSAYLSDSYDVIMLWETPVPFLKLLYPDALIINQMPGAFSRSPYPHTITFDIFGLYKDSTLTVFDNEIKDGITRDDEQDLAKKFMDISRISMNALQPFTRKDLDPLNKYSTLALLPLQVSAHYAFKTDTSYSNQMEFLLDVMSRVDPSVGVVVTQYMTPHVSDTILNESVLSTLKNKWPNIIYNPIFEKINSVSQYLLPIVDNVITCSSSLGLQAIAWCRGVTVFGDTYLKSYSNKEVNEISTCCNNSVSNNILSFILSRNQPLASAVIKDANFLSCLLEKLVYFYKNDRDDISKLPSYLDIDPCYSERLLNEFNMARVSKELSELAFPLSNPNKEIHKFNRFANDPEVKIITFDVFDTLVNRPTENPIDIFKFIERDMLRITNGIAENFSRIRQTAEIESRCEDENDEVTLDTIYEKIKSYYSLSDDLISIMKEVEINAELNMIEVRPLGKKIWDIAKSTKKPIYIISDMYLPYDIINRILELNGYNGFNKLYLSNDYGCSKKNGLLFDIILDDLKVLPTDILHIGDNKISDIEQPKSRGIRAYRTPRAIDRLRGNSFYSNIFPRKFGEGELSRSAIAGLIAKKLFDSESVSNEKDSHFQGNPLNLGYAGMGPFVTGFMLWLGRQAKRDNVSHLYFLSREGWLLKQVYDVLHKNIPDAVPSVYLYASRRATRVASLFTLSDVLSLSGHPYRNGVSVGDLLADRFGINPDLVSPEKWTAAGIENKDDFISSNQLDRKKFSVLCSNICDVILEQAEKERAIYISYLESTGLLQADNPAVIDVGWRANMQGALSSLIGKDLLGYYYATLQGTEVWTNKGLKCWGYMGDLLSSNHPSHIVNNRPLLEYMMCHTEPSLISMSGDEIFKPVFRVEDNIGSRRAFLELVHQGTIQFASDFKKSFENSLDSIWIDPFLGESILNSFFQKPHKIDASMFKDHFFEDALAGVKKRYIISPEAEEHKKKSVWQQGAISVWSPKKEEKKPSNINNNSFIESNKIPSYATNNKIIHIIENSIIKSFVSDRKYAKYRKDRAGFFMDSKKEFMHRWYMKYK